MTARPLPAVPAPAPVVSRTTRSQADWAAVAAVAPQLAATAQRYLAQVEISQRPNTILKTDETLRSFCGYLTAAHPTVNGFAQVTRVHVEGYKLVLARHVTAKGTPLALNTLRQRLGMLRSFFERIIEWGWDDTPARMPIFSADLPLADEPLPKALDDASAARFLQAAAAEADPLRALVVDLLARTGMRVGELCALEADALSRRAGGWWLKIPVGKLRNDRYIPVHPRLVELLLAWQARHDPAGTGLLLTNDGRPLNRHVVTRMVRRVARNAGIGHIHPHQLRHTLGTQFGRRGAPPRCSDRCPPLRPQDHHSIRARHNLDRHASYIVTAFIAGAS